MPRSWTRAPSLVYLQAMGAWGYASFDNDSAMDWLGELRDGSPSLVVDTLRAVADARPDAYLEADPCCAALAAAELVAAGHGMGDERVDEDARDWLDQHRPTLAATDLGLARGAVDRVFRASELRELWDEDAADGEWHSDVRELLRRLGA